MITRVDATEVLSSDDRDQRLGDANPTVRCLARLSKTGMPDQVVDWTGDEMAKGTSGADLMSAHVAVFGTIIGNIAAMALRGRSDEKQHEIAEVLANDLGRRVRDNLLVTLIRSHGIEHLTDLVTPLTPEELSEIVQA